MPAQYPEPGEPALEALKLSRSGMPLPEIAEKLGVTAERATELIEHGAQTEERVRQMEADAREPPPIDER